MRRGPHAEWPGSVACIGAMTGVLCRRFVGTGGSATFFVRLEVDGPVVEELELSLWLGAGRVCWRGTTLVTAAQFMVAASGFSSKLRWCSVLLGALLCVLYLWWWRSLRLVMYNCFLLK
jgi:hypothetical protein